jgi:hypothetical protein
VEAHTRKLWDKQNRHPGDRQRLFTAVAEAMPDVSRVLYPGSYVDVAPSFVFDDATYVDLDRRAERFFADTDGVNEIIAANRAGRAPASWRFIPGDYSALSLPEARFDLLISLYAGFISEHCTRFLRRGGSLVVNPSHGDVAMASIDARYELEAVVHSRSGTYRVSDRAIETYLIPKREGDITRELLHELGRGVAYTKTPFAYLFRRTK